MPNRSNASALWCHPRVHGLLKLLCATLVVTGCGGGGSSSDSNATGTTPTASAFSAGPISGFGSVIVRGVRFDDSAARVTDDDDTPHRSDELRLGMMAEIESAGIATDATGSHAAARSIRFGSEIVGPVFSIAADGTSLVVLGETVKVNAATLFDDRLAGGIAALVAGSSVVEVHGLFDVASGTYTATRIEPKTAAAFYKLRGSVTALDTTAHTLRIGSGTETISYDAIAASVPAALANGLLVRVKLQTTKVAGRWVATAIASGVRKLDDHDEAELEGTITASTFATDGKFSVNGIAVDASKAAFPNGSAGIVVGARVEVHGAAVAGVIVATRVAIETEHERELAGFELHGTVSAFDAGAKTFVVRGVTVSFASATLEIRKGVLADLGNGKKVEVRGVRSATSAATLVASRITFED